MPATRVPGWHLAQITTPQAEQANGSKPLRLFRRTRKTPARGRKTQGAQSSGTPVPDSIQSSPAVVAISELSLMKYAQEEPMDGFSSMKNRFAFCV